AIADLVITHAHIDHIGGLPSLIESLRLGGRNAPLRIWGLPTVIQVAQQLVGVYDFELTLNTWTFDVSFHSLKSGQQPTFAGIETRVVAMDHSVPSIGLRLELPAGALAYTCDTQPNPHIQELGEGARILITECTYLHSGESAARASRHLTALEAGQ